MAAHPDDPGDDNSTLTLYSTDEAPPAAHADPYYGTRFHDPARVILPGTDSLDSTPQCSPRRRGLSVSSEHEPHWRGLAESLPPPTTPHVPSTVLVPPVAFVDLPPSNDGGGPTGRPPRRHRRMRRDPYHVPYRSSTSFEPQRHPRRVTSQLRRTLRVVCLVVVVLSLLTLGLSVVGLGDAVQVVCRPGQVGLHVVRLVTSVGCILVPLVLLCLAGSRGLNSGKMNIVLDRWEVTRGFQALHVALAGVTFALLVADHRPDDGTFCRSEWGQVAAFCHGGAFVLLLSVVKILHLTLRRRVSWWPVGGGMEPALQPADYTWRPPDAAHH